jgi:site-specific recombinase XerD
VQVSDIDAQRRLIHVRGKGAKDRYVPLPEALLPRLRQFWKTHRSIPWLFPNPNCRHNPEPLRHHQVQRAFEAARQRAGLRKHPTVHTLRHAYATHLLELGVNQRLIQAVLGHSSPKTTCLYTHLTAPACASLHPPLNQLLVQL